MDGFAEGYHTPYLHAQSLRDTTAAEETTNPLSDALGYQLSGPHRMVSWAGERSEKTEYSSPTQCLVEAGAGGLWNRPDPVPLPPGVNPTRAPTWNIDSFQFFPSFVLNFRSDNYTVKTHYPTGPDRHMFEITLYFQPPREPQRSAWPTR